MIDPSSNWIGSPNLPREGSSLDSQKHPGHRLQIAVCEAVERRLVSLAAEPQD